MLLSDLGQHHNLEDIPSFCQPLFLFHIRRIKWYRSNDPEIIQQMQGPILNPSSEQSELAPGLLKLVRDTLLKDPNYLERLKRHYRMFKEKVDLDHFQPNDKLPVSRIRKRHRPDSK